MHATRRRTFAATAGSATAFSYGTKVADVTEDKGSEKTDRDVLVCVPCYNAEATIVECVEPFLGREDTHVLLVDDHSERRLQDFIKQHASADWSNVTLVRPDDKVYAEGARNLGIRQALDDGYRLLVFIDSDIIVSVSFLAEIQAFLQANAEDVVVSATIEPFGSVVQYAETLINFSRYLPRARPESRRTRHLAFVCVRPGPGQISREALPVRRQSRPSGRLVERRRYPVLRIDQVELWCHRFSHLESGVGPAQTPSEQSLAGLKVSATVCTGDDPLRALAVLAAERHPVVPPAHAAFLAHGNPPRGARTDWRLAVSACLLASGFLSKRLCDSITMGSRRLMRKGAMRENPLRRKLKQGQPAYGVWVTLESPNVTEAFAALGVACRESIPRHLQNSRQRSFSPATFRTISRGKLLSHWCWAISAVMIPTA